MAAIDLLLCHLCPGDRVVAPHDGYSGTSWLMYISAERAGFEAAFVDQGDADALASALATRPKLVLIETPGTPLLRVIDIAAVSWQAKAVGVLVAVDIRFLSPALQDSTAWLAQSITATCRESRGSWR